jgi:uncharacterized repeat protein (TIGR01451 family)
MKMVVSIFPSPSSTFELAPKVNNYAIFTLATEGLYLENNILQFDPDTQSRSELELHPPICLVPAASGALVLSQENASFTAINNDISNLGTGGIAGEAVGFQVKATPTVTITDNTISHIIGPSIGTPGWFPLVIAKAIGIDLQEVETAYLSANHVHHIQGGPYVDYFYYQLQGGHALGARFILVENATFENNVVSQIILGPLSQIDNISDRAGSGIQVFASSVQILNNTFYDILPPEPDLNWPGYAMGLVIEGEVTAVNNIFMKQQQAIVGNAAYSMTLDYNVFWDNEENYYDAPPGQHDIYANPLLVDPDNGDFHLSPNSPIIDAGATNFVASDFEGEPRPLDGNNDGLTLPDIGADEYYPGFADSHKMVDKLLVVPGDTLFYTVTITSPSGWLPITNARLTDTLPVSLIYVLGSLTASAGSWGYSSGIITWTGNIPAGQFVTLTFRAIIQPDLTGTYAIVN